MNRSARRVIFYILIVIFITISYGAILYAQGYRYNISHGEFTRTGAVYIKVNTSATVSVNGVDRSTTSFLTDAATVDGLLPGTYAVAVHKDGYTTWQKDVTIEEGLVQDYSHVLILPDVDPDESAAIEDIDDLLYPPTPTPVPSINGSPVATPRPSRTPTPSPSVSPTPDTSAPYYLEDKTLYVQSPSGPQQLGTDITQVFQSPDGREIMWYTNSQVWVYWLANTDYQPFHVAGDIAVVAHLTHPIIAAGWYHDSAHVVTDDGTATAHEYTIFELDTRGGQNVISF